MAMSQRDLLGRRSSGFCVGALLVALASASSTPVLAQQPPRREAPGVAVTWPWVLANLIPSPQVAVGDPGAAFGLGWQVTPLLLGLRVQSGLSPWRVLVAEPLVRHAGSIELYAQPELFFRGRHFGESWLLATGLRGYIPLHHNGEYLSLSLAAGYVASQEITSGVLAWNHSPAVEVGVYVLFGGLGVRTRYTPLSREGWLLFTFNLALF